ncbi:hypothetical protein, partial [Pseudacidovorax intermedius]|uniref:hypothetical protein n=1 Tax=Pseudacidovorax intermedius TaxID=433924 RepID=UPI0031F693A4
MRKAAASELLDAGLGRLAILRSSQRMRVPGRWMRMPTIPNRSSPPFHGVAGDTPPGPPCASRCGSR